VTAAAVMRPSHRAVRLTAAPAMALRSLWREVRDTGLITCERLQYTDIWVEMADSRFGDALLPDGRDIYIFMLVVDFLRAPFHRHLAAIV